jgi:hypothetical protein
MDRLFGQRFDAQRPQAEQWSSAIQERTGAQHDRESTRPGVQGLGRAGARVRWVVGAQPEHHASNNRLDSAGARDIASVLRHSPPSLATLLLVNNDGAGRSTRLS